jgi:hypothetical protein
MISSAVLVQMKACLRSFHPVMKLSDLRVEVFHAGEDSAADGLPVGDAEPDFDEVQPGP